MAFDEMLLRSMNQPVLRRYRWAEATVSFGYFGRLDEARDFAARRELVRRWTGGGIVPHGDDLTYSLIINASDPACRLSSLVLYQRIHEVIREALALGGISAVLVGTARPRVSDACFANPVAADLIENGCKIAGAAHRRTRAGLLHQGSIQRYGAGAELARTMAAKLARRVVAGGVSRDLLAAAEKLAVEKYATREWLERR